MITAVMDLEQTMLTQCCVFVELFYKDADSESTTICEGDLPSARLSTTDDKGEGKLKRRKRKTAATQWNQKKRTSSAKMQSRRRNGVGATDDE
jgi:hypothetical protein